jgi:glutamate carboxypeptidase
MTASTMTPPLPSAAELDALRAVVRADLPAYLDDLERLVNIDCGSYTPDGVNQVARWVEDFLTDLGAEVQAHPDPDGGLGDTLVATFSGRPGGARALLIGHMDTVFEPGTAAERPFRIQDGVAYGPGVTDMKGGLLAGLYALKAIVTERGGVPFERLVFIANPDEEIGSPSSTPHIQAQAAGTDVALVLECARANGDIVSARKGILDLRIVVHGRAAHAGVEPEKGRNAILEGARIVEDLHLLNGQWPGVTVNVGLITGGTRPNVVAERCTLEVDVRATTRDALETAEAAIRRIAEATEIPDVTVDFESMARWWPMERLGRSGHLVEHAQGVADLLGFSVAEASTGGASDANSTSGMGIPSLDGLGPIGGNDHSPAEYLDVDSIVPRTTLVAGLLLAIAADPEVLAWRERPDARSGDDRRDGVEPRQPDTEAPADLP